MYRIASQPKHIYIYIKQIGGLKLLREIVKVFFLWYEIAELTISGQKRDSPLPGQ